MRFYTGSEQYTGEDGDKVSISVTIEPVAGSELGISLKEAMQLAFKNWIVVTLKFNNHIYLIDPEQILRFMEKK